MTTSLESTLDTDGRLEGVRARNIEFSTVSRSSGFAAKCEVRLTGALKYSFLETGQCPIWRSPLVAICSLVI